MTSLWDRVTRVRAGIWFVFAVALTVAGYADGADIVWALLWLMPHAVILLGVWRGSRAAWAVLVAVSASFAIALAVVGAGMLFGSGFFMNISWSGPTVHGAALLCLVAFRASRRRAKTHHVNHLRGLQPWASANHAVPPADCEES